jgi:hypothetical protein
MIDPFTSVQGVWELVDGTPVVTPSILEGSQAIECVEQRLLHATGGGLAVPLQVVVVQSQPEVDLFEQLPFVVFHVIRPGRGSRCRQSTGWRRA